MGALFRRLRGLSVDLSPLRHRDFRNLWLGQATSSLGSQLTIVAVPFQVYALTRSTIAVGAVGVVEAAPWLISGVLGGALADRLDRRRLMLIADALMAMTSGVLAVNSLSGHPNLFLLYAMVFAAAAPAALHRTAMRSSIPRLVGVELMVPAGQLENVYYQTGAIAGPALAGLVIAGLGLPAAYAVDAVTFCVSFALVWRLAPLAPLHDAEPLGLRMIADGFRYVVSSPVVFASQLVDLSAMFFGMPDALFPALAARLGGGARTVGLLFAAPALGALVLNLVGGPLARVRRQGLGLLVAVAAWSLALVVVGLSPWLWVALLGLALAGAGDMVSGVYRTAMVMTVTPDSMRGRLSGVELVFYSTGPIFGGLESGAVAALLGVPFAIVSGGIASMVGAILVAVRYPQLIRYRADPAPPAK